MNYDLDLKNQHFKKQLHKLQNEFSVLNEQKNYLEIQLEEKEAIIKFNNQKTQKSDSTETNSMVI